MRLATLRLVRYGPFDDVTVALSAAPGQVNVLCAPNGAGKSVLRQAFQDLLFGIGGQTPMGFRFGYPGMRVAATALMPDGQMHGFGRRKGQGNTWTDAEGAVGHDPVVAGAFLNTDVRVLERLFALDTQRLRDGGDELLTAGGAVAEALLAASGLSSARKAREELEQIAETLAPQRRAAGRPFYQALDKFVAARKSAAASLVKPDAWERREREVVEAQAALEEHRAQAAAAAAQSSRLHRIRRVRVPLAEHDAAAAWLATHPEAPDLPPSLAQRLADARAALAAVRQREELEQGRHARLLTDMQAIAVDETLLAETAAIEAFAEQAGAVEKARTDIPKLQSERAQIEARLAKLMKDLVAPVPREQVARLIPRPLEVAHARLLIGQHETRAQALRSAAETLRQLERDIAGKQAALAELPEAAETGTLAALVKEIRDAGDPATQSEQIAAAAARAQAALTAALAQVPYWSGTATDLLEPPTPADAAYDRAHQALAKAEVALGRQDDALAAARARQAETSEAESAARAGGDLPTLAALQAARQSRDQLYGLVARLAFNGGVPQAEQDEATGGMPLSLAYQQAVAHADRVADRRAEESTRLAQAEALTHQRKAADLAVERASAGREAAGRDAAAALAAWQALLPAPLAPSARLDELRAFRAARSRVIERAAEAAEAAARTDRHATRQADWAERLAAALGCAAAALPALLAAAEQALAAANRADKERTSLSAALAELTRRRTAVAAEHAKAAAALTAWHDDWSAALTSLARPPNEPPAVTAEVLRLLEELDRANDNATNLSARIADMQRDNDDFCGGVAALAARLNLAIASTDCETMLAFVRAQRERLTHHRDRESRRQGLLREAEQAASACAELQAASRHRAEALQAVLTACGAASPEEAEQVLALAAIRASQAETIARRAATLVTEGDGMDLAALRAEVATIAADDLPGALAAADSAASEANAAAQEAAATEALKRDELNRLSQDTAYAAARAAESEAAATAGRVLREALTARLAAALLRQAMNAVESEGASELLGRIGGWFRRLTGAAYKHILSEAENGKQVLVAVPAEHPDEPKRMAELSEGTRDQLYLAMRLETVAAHPDRLPFIADDILQSFDDTRAAAALDALAELSRTTQVIVLTHHGHIRDLAKARGAHIATFATGTVAA
ncbi:MAG TPA: AAA family ATPase [Acetobacteraceae bacterium]|nr:AAA family ATPase [Acetobacteraceae bacterium]